MSNLIAKLLFLPTLCYNILLSKLISGRNWFDKVDATLILGALPIKSVRNKLSVNKFVNMCKEWPGPVNEYQSMDIEQLWLATIDYTCPNLNQINDGVRFIQKAKESSETVYLHCKAGRGRSATIAVAWLIHSKKMSLDEAQKHLSAIRPHISSNLHERQPLIDFALQESNENTT